MFPTASARRATLLALALTAPLTSAWAQAGSTPAAPAGTPTAAPAAPAASKAWRYSTPRLIAAQVDEWLAQPQQVLVLDIRRPDELIKYGSFPVYINIQYKDLERQLAYLPRDRKIVTVSNRAQRAGAAGDLLTAKGFYVIGATGSADYEEEGGKAVLHLQAPVATASAGAAPTRTP